MADAIIGGEAPPAAAELLAFPPGTVWMMVLSREADPTGKTVKVNVYCTNMASYVGYNAAGPGYDIPAGGPFIATEVPTAWEYPPSGGSPGLVLTTDIVIADAGFYHFEAQCSEVRRHVDCQVGVNQPGDARMGPVFDPAAIRDNTIAGRRQLERDRMANLARPTPLIGRPRGTRVRMPRRTP